MIKNANIETNLQGILAGTTANVNGLNASNAGNPDAAFLEMLKTAEMSGEDVKKIILDLDQKNLEAFEISPELVEDVLNAKYEIKNPKALNQNTNPELAALLKSGAKEAPVSSVNGAGINKDVAPQAILKNEPSISATDVKTTVDPFTSKVRQAEDASLQFSPDRKSIFDVKNTNAEKLTNKETIVAEQTNTKIALSDRPVNLKEMNASVPEATTGVPVANKEKADVVNMADLLAQRNSMNNKVSKEMATKQYLGNGQIEKDTSIFSANKKVEAEMAVKGIGEKQEILLNELSTANKLVQMNPESKNQMNFGTETNSAKVFDLSNLNNNSIKTEGQMISAIQDYIIQSRASSSKEVSVNFSHQDLGVVGLNVKKMQDDSLQIVVGTQNAVASQFFTQNQHDLMAGLARSGLNVSEFRIETSASSSNQNFSENNAKSGGQSAGQQQFSDSNEQRRQDSQRRSDLWNTMYQREAA